MSAWLVRRSSPRAFMASTCRACRSCSRRGSCTEAPLTDEIQAKMAAELGCDSLRYLPVEAVARAIRFPADVALPGLYYGRLSHRLRSATLPSGAQKAQHDHDGDLRTYETSHACEQVNCRSVTCGIRSDRRASSCSRMRRSKCVR